MGHAKFGQLAECPCGLIRRRRIAKMDEEFGFTVTLQGWRLGDLRPLAGQGDMRKAIAAYAADPKGWLYLHGPFGDGKTTALVVIVNELRAKGFTALFCVVPELLGWLKETFHPESGRRFDEDWDYIKAVPFLGLDDFGTEVGTPWADERLYELLNWRYRCQLPTVVTCNNKPENARDGRLTSRFRDVMFCQVVECGKDDVRRLKR